jgi:hypothetical protein
MFMVRSGNPASPGEHRRKNYDARITVSSAGATFVFTAPGTSNIELNMTSAFCIVAIAGLIAAV